MVWIPKEPKYKPKPPKPNNTPTNTPTNTPMNREEAIRVLEYTLDCADRETPKGANEAEAIPMAIEALEREDKILKEIERIVLYGERSE